MLSWQQQDQMGRTTLLRSYTPGGDEWTLAAEISLTYDAADQSDAGLPPRRGRAPLAAHEQRRLRPKPKRTPSAGHCAQAEHWAARRA